MKLKPLQDKIVIKPDTRVLSTVLIVENKEKVLEAQLQAMQDEIISLRAAVDAAASAKKVDANSQKVQELDAWMADVKSKPVEKKSKDNMLYFRGGYAGNDQSMNATTNTVTIDGNASETIDGATTKTLVTQYASYTIQCDSTTWWVQ